MSAIALLSRQEIVALGWTLLHFCWQGTAVAVAYAIIDRLTSRHTSKVRYAVALAAFMLMPLVVLGTFAIEMRIAAPAAATKDVAPVVTDFFLTEHTPTVHEISLASGFEQQEQWIVVRAERLLPWVDAFWLVGVLLFALRSLGGWWQLELIRRRALRMVPQELERAFHRISEQVHAGRRVALRISDQVISPLAMGIWRATVILPMSTVTGMPKEELEAVIAHELGHIRRWDFVWNLMQTAVESVLFFHPAVWRLSRIVRERREVCCDEIAVECCAGASRLRARPAPPRRTAHRQSPHGNGPRRMRRIAARTSQKSSGRRHGNGGQNDQWSQRSNSRSRRNGAAVGTKSNYGGSSTGTLRDAARRRHGRRHHTRVNLVPDDRFKGDRIKENRS